MPARRLPPRPRWETTVVRQEVVGLLAPVWIVQADMEHDAYVVIPALLNLPVAARQVTDATTADRQEIDRRAPIPLEKDEDASTDDSHGTAPDDDDGLHGPEAEAQSDAVQ